MNLEYLEENKLRNFEYYFSTFLERYKELWQYQDNSDIIEEVVNLLFKTYKTGYRIFIIGNGGSAANASHFAQDLAKGTMPNYHDLRDFDGGTLKAISLTDNISFITATSNDDGYDNIFTNQLKMHQPMPDDVLIAISGSGNSPNILKAVKHINEMHGKIIAFTGFDGGKLRKSTQLCIHFPFKDMCMTEAYHSLVMHYIVEKIKYLRIKDKNEN